MAGENWGRVCLFLIVAIAALILLAAPPSILKQNGEKTSCSPGPCEDALKPLTGDAALQRLLEGNKRFVDGNGKTADLGAEKRSELLQGQNPFAIIVSCSDSRVEPAHIFDVGLGDIFVVRSAGNVLDGAGLGSVEYGATHLNAPLIVVLGHEHCGAVNAVCSGQPIEGRMTDVVALIRPSLDKVEREQKGLEGEALEEAVADENVRHTVETLREDPVIAELVAEGKLKIVGAKYSLTTGTVRLID